MILPGRILIGLYALGLLAACASGRAIDEPTVTTEAELPGIELLGPHVGADRIDAAIEGGRLVLDVHSTTGIGRARISRPHAGWPGQIRFRLHLEALEGFEVRGASTFSIGATITTPHPIVVDLPAGIASRDTADLRVQWVDRYR